MTLGAPSSTSQPSQPTRVLLEALKSELHFYRDFFWRYQDALRAATVADPEVAELLSGLGAAPPPSSDMQESCDATEEPLLTQRRPFSVGYELQLAEAKNRSLDEEASTLHEHFKRRITELDNTVRHERQQRAHVLQENIQLREANHALCCEVRRLRDGCAELSTLHLSRLQVIFLMVDEHLWRARIEAEALRYLTLRAVDTPQVSLADRLGSLGAAAASASTASLNAVLSSASSRSRLSAAVSHVFDTYYPTTRFAARDVAFSVAQCEDQFELVAAEFRQRMRALAFPESLVAARAALLQQNDHWRSDSVNSFPPSIGGSSVRDAHHKHRLVQQAVTGSRRALTEEDERLVELCLAAHRRDVAHVLAADEPLAIGSAAVVTQPQPTSSLPSLQVPTRSLAPAEALQTTYYAEEWAVEDEPKPSASMPMLPHDATVDHAHASRHLHPTEAELTKRRAVELVRQFHDPLAPTRPPSMSDAFHLTAPSSSAATTAAPTQEDHAIETFLARRAIRLLQSADGAATQAAIRSHQKLSPSDAALNLTPAPAGGHPASMMVVACSALDPLVKTQQTLRSSVLQLQRERDDALRRNIELEQRLTESKASVSRLRHKSMDQAMHRMEALEHEEEGRVNVAPNDDADESIQSSRRATAALPRLGAINGNITVAPQHHAHFKDDSVAPPSPAPVPPVPSQQLITPSAADAASSRLGALPPQVVDRIAQASLDMKDIETIARMSQDPSLRGRMMRQMKELHHEVAELLR